MGGASDGQVATDMMVSTGHILGEVDVLNLTTGKEMSSVWLYSMISIVMVSGSMTSLAITGSQLYARLSQSSSHIKRPLYP